MWLIIAYYFGWVGIGGRGMGGAYTFAHKEGHHRNGGLYRPWIARTVGNFWENWMGVWCAAVALAASLVVDSREAAAGRMISRLLLCLA